MKKVLSLLFFVFLCQYANAQNIANPDQPYDCYCLLHPFGFLKDVASSFWCEIKLPTSDKYLRLKDEEGNNISFKGEGDLFMYMSKRGWEYVDTLTKGANVYYIMKKKVLKDEDASEFLTFNN